MKRNLLTSTLIVIVSYSCLVMAQETKLVPKEVHSPDSWVEGWNPWFSIGGTVNFGHSRSVLGQIDGSSWTLGGSLDTGVEYNHNNHQWNTTLNILEAFSYAPPLSELIKSSDQVQLKTDYYYRIPKAQWTGPFALGQLDTSLFEGEDVRPGDNNVWTVDGKEFHKGHRVKLTESFSPLHLKEVVGWFARPFSRPTIQWQITTGVGAYQVFADGQYALNDKADTPQIELQRLESYQQVGSETGMEVKGVLFKEKFSYKAYGIVMIPFYRSKGLGEEKSAFEMANVDLGVKFSFRLLSWASLDYEFRAVRQPQLLDAFQIQNNLMLTFKYEPIKKKIPQKSK